MTSSRTKSAGDPTLAIGISIEQKRRVLEPDCIRFLGGDEAMTLSSPAMIAWMEIASRELVKPHLAVGQSTVGTLVNVRHMGPARAGSIVLFHSELMVVDGRRLSFKVKAEQDGETVGEGAHERFVIDIGRFLEKLKRAR